MWVFLAIGNQNETKGLPHKAHLGITPFSDESHQLFLASLPYMLEL